MKINRIIETALYCDDVEPMLAFYRGLFGFEIILSSLPRGVFLRCGESILIIFNRSMTLRGGQLPPHGSTGPHHIAFEIPDEEYEQWKDVFVKKGVAIEKEMVWEDSQAKSFYFRDPAGNNIEIAQKKLWS